MKKREKECKFINLKYLLNNKLPTVKEYLKHNNIDFNNDDVDVLLDFVSQLSTVAEDEILQNFILGYKISRLDKEFDLIKMDDNSIVNIELKEKYEDIKQISNNYKVLRTFNSKSNISLFCYCKKEFRIYYYDYDLNDFIESSIIEINNKLQNIIIPKMIDINFKVYSVYKNPDFFLNNEYCLSKSQERIYDDIMKNIDRKPIIVQGDAGTGKSLLSLCIHKDLIKSEKSVFLAPIKIYTIIDSKLISKYNISTVKEFIANNTIVDYIIVDEAQKITKEDFSMLKKLAQKNILLFGDRLQDIKNIGYFNKLSSMKTINKVLNMKSIIRSNNTFVTFAKKVLNIDVSRKYEVDPQKIEIVMYKDNFDLQEYVYIEPLKSLHFSKCITNNQCIHKNCMKYKKNFKVSKCIDDIDSCSLEFDKVAIYLCDSYKLVLSTDNKKKIIPTKKSNIYNFEKELYLMITRAVSKLLIITDDLEVYNYLMTKKEELFFNIK